MLTKILPIDSKLSFNNFCILNHGRISETEKDIDTLDPPLKTPFFKGGVGTVEQLIFGFVSRWLENRSNAENRSKRL